MSAVIAVALPVFVLIALGAAAGRFGALAASDSAALNRFVFRIAMPGALFGLAARSGMPGADDLRLASAYGVAALTAISAGFFLSRVLFGANAREAGAYAFASTIGNAVFLGLPIAMNIDGWAQPFIVLMLIEGTAVIAIGAALMTPRNGSGFFFHILVTGRNPLVAAMLLGFLYAGLGFSLTGPVETLFAYLGRAAGPTALLSLGLFLATHKFPPVAKVAGRVALIAAVKMALLPTVALSLALALGIEDPTRIGALALFTVVPSGVVAYLMAGQQKICEMEVAAAVLATTLLAAASISSVLATFA